MKRPHTNSVTGKPWQWCQHPPDHPGSSINGHCIATTSTPTTFHRGGRPVTDWLCDYHAARALAQDNQPALIGGAP